MELVLELRLVAEIPARPAAVTQLDEVQLANAFFAARALEPRRRIA